MPKDLHQRVIALIKQLRPETPKSSLTGEAKLGADVGLDSFTLMALAVRLHEELGVDLAALAQRAPEIQTIDDLVSIVGGISHARH